MVFKGRFFNFKKSDSCSPDGSPSSPRSFGSNSPSRSDKKKAKSTAKDSQIANTASATGFSDAYRTKQVKDGTKKKDAKGNESQAQQESRWSSPKPSSGGEFGCSSTPSSGLKSKVVAAAAAGATSGKESPSSSVSPILASSLGLNRIKTRSGPLPQESFFGFRNDKGSTIGVSNLSKPGSDVGKMKEPVNYRKVAFQESSGSGNWVDNGSNSDSMSTGSAPSRDQSPNVLPRSRLQNAESSAESEHFKRESLLSCYPAVVCVFTLTWFKVVP